MDSTLKTNRVRTWIVKPCAIADREHQLAQRYYAHTFHRSGVICVARAFYPLPLTHCWAILAHEVGHLLAGEQGEEEDADQFAEDFFDIRIIYTTTEHGEELQTVTLAEAKRISEHTFVIYYPDGLR